jgi:hypothetical protein
MFATPPNHHNPPFWGLCMMATDMGSPLDPEELAQVRAAIAEADDEARTMRKVILATVPFWAVCVRCFAWQECVRRLSLLPARACELSVRPRPLEVVQGYSIALAMILSAAVAFVDVLFCGWLLLWPTPHRVLTSVTDCSLSGASCCLSDRPPSLPPSSPLPCHTTLTRPLSSQPHPSLLGCRLPPRAGVCMWHKAGCGGRLLRRVVVAGCETLVIA